MEIRKFDVDLGENGHVESGPVQFNEDWPGIFLRGDDAFGYLMAIRALIQELDGPTGFAEWLMGLTDEAAEAGDEGAKKQRAHINSVGLGLSQLEGLANLLESCIIK